MCENWMAVSNAITVMVIILEVFQGLKHIWLELGHGVEICPKVPKDVQDAALSEMNKPSKKPKNAINSIDDLQDCQVISASSKDKNLVHEKLIKFITSNNIAFDVVEAQSFVELLRSVAEYGPDYKLPGPLTLQKKIIPNREMEYEVGFGMQAKEEVLTHMDEVKASWAETGCTLMLHKWHNDVIHVVAYSPQGALFVNFYEISVQREMNFDIKATVGSIIEDIGVDHVVQLITNEATIFDSVGKMLTSTYPKICNVQCVAGEIHFFLKEVYDEIDWIHRIIELGKLVVEHIHGDATISQLMKRKFKRPFMLNFVTYYQVLQSIFDHKHELQRLVRPSESNLLNHNKGNGAKHFFDIIQNAEFWNDGEELLEIMKLVFRVLCLVEYDGSTSGYLYEAMEIAKEAIKVQSIKTKTKYGKMFNIFMKQSNTIIHPVHLAAAFLNPAFMNSREFKVDYQLQKGIDFIMNYLVDNKEKEKLKEEVQLYLLKVPNMFTVAAIQKLQKFHPRIWWNFFGKHLPILRKYAMRILSQPCKCSWLPHNLCNVVQKEKVNSGPIFRKHILNLRMNAMIMERLRTSSDGQSFEPIDLDKCNGLPDYVDPSQGWGDGDQMEIITENAQEANYIGILGAHAKPSSLSSCPSSHTNGASNIAPRRWIKLFHVIHFIYALRRASQTKKWGENLNLGCEYQNNQFIDSNWPAMHWTN